LNDEKASPESRAYSPKAGSRVIDELWSTIRPGDTKACQS
jgi:hypothetical protein